MNRKHTNFLDPETIRQLRQLQSILPPQDEEFCQPPLEWTESKKSFLQSVQIWVTELPNFITQCQNLLQMNEESWFGLDKGIIQVQDKMSGDLTPEVVRRMMEKMLAERDEEWEAKLFKEKEKWNVTPQENSINQADMRPDQSQYLPAKPSGKLPGSNDHFRGQYSKCFTDNQGDVDYEAWKLDMQIFLEDYRAHFYTNRLQVQAYYKATEGRAKKVLLPLMNENHPQHVATAKEVLKALDEEFFDWNKLEDAKSNYAKINMGKNETYKNFRVRFRTLASDAQIDKDRLYDDLLRKINPRLLNDIKVELTRLRNNYQRLDELLCKVDRTNREIYNRIADGKSVNFAFESREA
ncbi:hypothetical protein K3495_g14353 [Podosphaera aphanis]|nr:hypothetical protein K3495_g14353 [Podosphaera aphanis]